VDLGSYTSTSGMSTLKTYLTAVNKIPSTSGVIVFFDEVENATKQSAANGAYADTSTTITYAAGSEIGAVVYNVDDSTPVKYQTESWYISGPQAPNGSTVYGGFDDTTDDIVITYPVAPAKTIAYSATDGERDTIDEYITYFNTEADADNFDLTLTATGKKEHTFLVDYVETDGTAGAMTVSGTVLAFFGSTTMTIGQASVDAASTSAGDTTGDLAIAYLLADGINDLASFTASAGGVAGYAYVVVSAARTKSTAADDTADVTPLAKWSIPTSLTISKTGGTTEWSANATNGETSYTLSIGAGVARYAGFILTAKNTKTGSDRSLTSIAGNNYFGTVSKLSARSFYNNGNIDNDADTTVDSEIGAYIRAFADSDAGTSATAATNRLAWL